MVALRRLRLRLLACKRIGLRPAIVLGLLCVGFLIMQGPSEDYASYVPKLVTQRVIAGASAEVPSPPAAAAAAAVAAEDKKVAADTADDYETLAVNGGADELLQKEEAPTSPAAALPAPASINAEARKTTILDFEKSLLTKEMVMEVAAPTLGGGHAVVVTFGTVSQGVLDVEGAKVVDVEAGQGSFERLARVLGE